MKHIKVEIVSNEYQQEELIALMDEYHATGFEQTSEKLIAYFEDNEFNKAEIGKILEGYEYNVSNIEEQNWNALWEKNFHPVIVNDFCAVRAHFHEAIPGVQHEIIITPKMSFGTGHHATTYMMMEQMRQLDFKGKSVFDFGTGTGILAILAEKLGASEVTAIDVDEWSIVNTKENIERNGCPQIKVSLSTSIHNRQFEIILANINRNVILEYLPQLATVITPNGNLLLSGLLEDDEEDIVKACQQNNLQFLRRNERQGWLSLLLMKP